MKYLVLLALLTSCAIPKRAHRVVKIVKKSDKIERCIKDLIGHYEVKPLEASQICKDIRDFNNIIK